MGKISHEDDADGELLAPGTFDDGYVVYGSRFWVLGVFFMISFNQSLFWISFSPIADNTKAYYGIDDATVALLLNWGTIFFCISSPFSSWFAASRHHGLKQVCIISAIASFFAMFLRALPAMTGTPRATWALVMLHLAQIVNACIGGPMMSCCSQLSATWFPDRERTRATAVATVSSSLGQAFGFFLGPLLVTTPSQMPLLLYTHLALAAVALIPTLAYLPGAPATPPSAAAEMEVTEPPISFWAGVVAVGRDANFLLVSLCTGSLGGLFNAWSGEFDQLLPPLDGDFTQTACGWLGFSSTMASVLGGLVCSSLADTRRFGRRMKTMVVVSSVANLAIVVFFALSLPTPFSYTPLIPAGFWTMMVTGTLSGLFFGCVAPLAYELGAELSYPVPQLVSNTMVALANNVMGLGFLFASPPLLHSRVLNLVTAALIGLCLLGLTGTRIRYRRKDAERLANGHSSDSLSING